MAYVTSWLGGQLLQPLVPLTN